MIPTKRTFFAAMSIVLLAVAGSLTAAAGSSSAAPGWRYTMVAFSNVSDTDLDVYESADATVFAPVRLSAYRPPSGLVRDPSIFRHSDGFYYLAYTTGGSGTTIGFARSSDRITWNYVSSYWAPLCCAGQPGTGTGAGSSGSTDSGSARIPLPSLPGFPGTPGSADGPSLSPFVTKAWAPEWFVDGNQVKVILSLSTGGGFVPHVITALDPSLTSWSAPVPLAGIGADHIDTTVIKDGATYHAFTKNETNKTIEHAIAPSASGPYSFVPAGNWGAPREGPAVVQLPNGGWRMYLDAYTEGRYLYTDSTDGLRTWSPLQTLPGLSGHVRHVGVMREPA